MTPLEEALEALRRIKEDEGRVCDEYEICEHASCASSYNSWAIADVTFRRLTGTELDIDDIPYHSV